MMHARPYQARPYPRTVAANIPRTKMREGPPHGQYQPVRPPTPDELVAVHPKKKEGK